MSNCFILAFWHNALVYNLHLWISLTTQILPHSKMFYQCARPCTVNYVKLLRMTTSIISYGLVFNLEKLSGSPYLNTIIVGSLRYSINLVCAVVDVRFAWAGRRLLHGVAMSFISACLGLVFIIVVLGQLFHFQNTPNYITSFDRNELVLECSSPSALFFTL